MGQAQQSHQQPPPPQQHVSRGGMVGQAGEKVSVACKLPRGFIMRGFQKSNEVESSGGAGLGTIERTYHRPTGDEVLIAGTAVRFGEPPPILVNGYRITRNVPKELWDQWLDANRNGDLVKNHIVYSRSSDIEGWAREHEKTLTGLEGIDPDNPSKRVRGILRGERPS